MVWCGRDSNPRPPAPKADALQAELSARYKRVKELLKNPTVISISLHVGCHPASRSVHSTPADNTRKRVWQYIEKEVYKCCPIRFDLGRGSYITGEYAVGIGFYRRHIGYLPWYACASKYLLTKCERLKEIIYLTSNAVVYSSTKVQQKILLARAPTVTVHNRFSCVLYSKLPLETF